MGVRITSIVPGKSEFPACDTVENRCPDTWSTMCLTFVDGEFTKVVDDGTRLV
jgi:hypothetical protein